MSILNAISPPRSVKGVHPRTLVEEREEDAPQQDDGWLEVGKRNRTVVTRTVGIGICVHPWVVDVTLGTRNRSRMPSLRYLAYMGASTGQLCGRKVKRIRSLLKIGERSGWISRCVYIPTTRDVLTRVAQRDRIHTIHDALAYMSHPQTVQVTSPTRPGVTIEASQQVLIEALPPILVLHLKRFLYDTAVSGVVKLGRQIRFGPELEIGQGAVGRGVTGLLKLELTVFLDRADVAGRAKNAFDEV